MEWEFRASDAAKAAHAHCDFVSYIRDKCTFDSDWQASEVVFAELVANVIRHAPGPIDITLRSDAAGRVTLSVHDTGSPFRVDGVLPDVWSESGRGLYIISKVCGNVVMTQTDTGKSVSAILPLTMQRFAQASKRA